MIVAEGGMSKVSRLVRIFDFLVNKRLSRLYRNGSVEANLGTNRDRPRLILFGQASSHHGAILREDTFHDNFSLHHLSKVDELTAVRLSHNGI